MKLPNGYGSIVKLKDTKRRKPYRVRITQGYSEEGKLISINLGYYPSQEEAREALQEYNSSPYDISANKTTFIDVYKRWSEIHFKKVSKSAIENYSNAYRNYCSSLYKMRMKDIRLTHLQAVVDNSGMAYPTRKVIKALLNQMFTFSMKNDIVEKRYSEYIDCGVNEGKTKRKPFTKQEIDKLFQNVEKLDYADTILIMIYTCMRIGELITIEIKNVHLDERYMIGGIKTEAGKNRVIPINRKIEPFIRKYYEMNKDKQYLIMNSLGKPMQYSNFRREKWDNIIEKLGLEGHTPHDCRHTGISLLDSAGANLLCIKRIVRTFSTRYYRRCLYS